MQVDVTSDSKFNDFHLGEWVTVVHQDDLVQDVYLWRAKITAVNPPTPTAEGTFQVYIRERAKELAAVSPSKIFKRSLGLPAV